jgi:hypothetical protein
MSTQHKYLATLAYYASRSITAVKMFLPCYCTLSLSLSLSLSQHTHTHIYLTVSDSGEQYHSLLLFNELTFHYLPNWVGTQPHQKVRCQYF